MNTPENLSALISGAVSPIFTGPVFASLWETIKGLLIRLQDLLSAINGSALRELSRMLDEALRHPGTRLLNDHLVWCFVGASLFVGTLAFAALWRMLLTGIRFDKVSFRKRKNSTPGFAISIRGAVSEYFRSVVKTILEGVILMCVAAVLTTVGYLLCKIGWYSYRASPVGQAYAAYFPHRAQLINMVLCRDLFLFPAMLTGISFGAGMAFFACCRLFHITRYVYLPRGPLGKIVLFALPLNVGAAAAVRTLFPIPHWGAAYAAALIPTLLVFAYCSRFTNRLMPELGMFFSVWKRKKDTPQHVVFLQDLNTGKKILEYDPLAEALTGKRFPVDDGIETQGLFLTRSGHEFILYRYGHDLFFQVDDRELLLRTDMSVQWRKKGRFGRCFQLDRDGTRLFRLAWSSLPLFGPQAPAAAFFDAFEGILKNRTAYENAFTVDPGADQAIG